MLRAMACIWSGVEWRGVRVRLAQRDEGGLPELSRDRSRSAMSGDRWIALQRFDRDRACSPEKSWLKTGSDGGEGAMRWNTR